MIDWTASMDQTFEYYIVDPTTWKDRTRLRSVKSCSITRDLESETLGSASFEIDEPIGECYIRVYLIASQNGYRERIPLGTFLVQTPSIGFDGKMSTYSLDAYTPLLELKENPPPLGYSILKETDVGWTNIMDTAYSIARENMRAPVIPAKCSETLYYNFISNTDDTWLTFIRDLISNAKYRLDIDPMGQIWFMPKQEIDAMSPVWTYSDDNSSILTPNITVDRDLYGIPNTIEVIYSMAGSEVYVGTYVNDDPESPVSTVSRGRKITHRETNPDVIGNPTTKQLDEYARQRLKELSSLECTVSYSHAYCPVKVGDCIRLDYTRSNIPKIKGRVISQTIKCGLGCQVTEKATFTTKLWR